MDPLDEDGLTVPLHDDPRIHARRWFLLGVLCLSLVLVVMSVSALNVALPTLQRQLGASAADLQWIVDAYAIAFAGVLLTAGALGDRYGRRHALLAGLAVFGAGASFGALATEPAQLVVGRAIMGVGAAFVMPSTLSMLTTIFLPHERRRAIAVWAGFAGAGAAIGPVVAGLLLEHYWWGAVMLANLPVVAVLMITMWAFAPDSRDETRAPLDVIGAGLSLVGLSALVFAIIELTAHGWRDASVLAAAAIAGLALGAFIVREQRTAHPMLPLEFFRDPRFSVGSAVLTTTFFILLGYFFLTTQFLQFGHGYSALEAGVATLPLALTALVMSPYSARLAERFGNGHVIAAGFVGIAAGAAILVQASLATPYGMLAVAFVLLGVGIGITSSPATGLIMTSVPPSKAGVASAVNQASRQLGGALGIAVLGSIANVVYRARIDLSGLDLSPSVRAAAEESVGAASTVAREIAAPEAALVRSADAFRQAYNAVSLVAMVMALVAAVTITAMFSRRREAAADLRDGAPGGHDVHEPRSYSDG